MTGQEILQRHIGHKLTGGLVQSFYLNKELIDTINVTFLKFDDQWTHIVTNDEQTTIRTQDTSIESTEFFGDEEFKYSIRQIENVFPDFTKYMDKRLLGFKELVLKDNETISFGLNFYFEDGLNFIIKNNNFPDDKSVYFFNNVNFDDLKEK
jgi:hypothetical protein